MQPSTAMTRFDLSMPFEEFDLEANRLKFIGPRVLGVVPVGVVASDVGRIKAKALLQKSRTTRRAPGTGYIRSQAEFESYSYACKEYGAEEVVDDATSAMYSDMVNSEQFAKRRAIDAVLKEYEEEVAAAIFNTAIWTGAALTTAVGTQWTTHATATPIDNIFAAKEKVLASGAQDANALILNAAAYFHLCNCDQIVGRLQATVTPTQEKLKSILAEMLGIDHILVAGGITNTANAQQAISAGRIWSPNKAMVAKIALTSDPKEVCLGRTFMWTGDGPGAPGAGDTELAVVVEDYREEPVRGGVVRARHWRDVNRIYPECGHLLTNVTNLS